MCGCGCGCGCVAVRAEFRCSHCHRCVRQIHIWDIHTHTLVTTRSGHTKGVVSIAYVEKAQLLLSAGFDLGIHAWDLASMGARPLFHLSGHKCVLMTAASLPRPHHVTHVCVAVCVAVCVCGCVAVWLCVCVAVRVAARVSLTSRREAYPCVPHSWALFTRFVGRMYSRDG